MKLVTLLLLLFSTTNVVATDVPVTIKATADNFFITVLSQGQNRTVVSPVNNANWTIPKNDVIQVPDTDLLNCSIDFITSSIGGYHSFTGTLTGNNGTVHAGNPVIKTYRALVNQVGEFPTTAMINQIYSTMTLEPTEVHNPGVWGATSIYGFDPATRWISSSSAPDYDDRTYTVHSVPCASVVKKTFVPGEPQAPAPRPIPFPLPIDVKGDHFTCYMLDKGPILPAEQITIKDQFGGAKVVLGMPKMICNPTKKIHRNTTFNIIDEKRHLVCYEMVEQSPNRDYDLEIQNQFETRIVKSTNRELFCVPSLKHHL